MLCECVHVSGGKLLMDMRRVEIGGRHCGAKFSTRLRQRESDAPMGGTVFRPMGVREVRMVLTERRHLKYSVVLNARESLE